jgi:hypothetical protein
MHRGRNADQVFGRLVDLLNRLDDAHIYYALLHTRDDSVMVDGRGQLRPPSATQSRRGTTWPRRPAADSYGRAVHSCRVSAAAGHEASLDTAAVARH